MSLFYLIGSAVKNRRDEMDLVYYKEDVFNHEEWIEEFLRNLVFETISPHSMGLTKEWLRAGFDRPLFVNYGG